MGERFRFFICEGALKGRILKIRWKLVPWEGENEEERQHEEASLMSYAFVGIRVLAFLPMVVWLGAVRFWWEAHGGYTINLIHFSLVSLSDSHILVAHKTPYYNLKRLMCCFPSGCKWKGWGFVRSPSPLGALSSSVLKLCLVPSTLKGAAGLRSKSRS